MHELDEVTEAMRLCARCGGNAFYWRTAIVARHADAPETSTPQAQHQPSWTCMSCGYIEPHERRTRREGIS